VYLHDKPDGVYPIEDDEYYAVVAVAPEVGGDTNLQRPQFSPDVSLDESVALFLDNGDLKIFHLPYRLPTKPHEASDIDKPSRRQYMAGNTILALLLGRDDGVDETYERLRVANGDWEIYGHDVYEDAKLDQAPYKHCLDLKNQANSRRFYP